MYAPHDMTWYEGAMVNSAMTYTRHVICGVMWQERKAANVIRSGSIQADRVSVYVPDTEHAFQVGDYLVPGIVRDKIDSAFKIADLLKKYPHAVKITSVDVKNYGYAGMQHIQLGGA